MKKDNSVIHIEGYKPEIEHGKIVYYAIKGKDRYPMPDCYKDMYDNDHLAIIKKHVEMPDLFGLSSKESDHYMPLSTIPPVVNKPTPVRG